MKDVAHDERVNHIRYRVDHSIAIFDFDIRLRDALPVGRDEARIERALQVDIDPQ